MFANHLVAKLKDKRKLTTSDIEQVMAKTQEDRMERVRRLIKDAHEHQQRDALETPLLEVLSMTLPAVLPREFILKQLSDLAAEGACLDFLPKPDVPHTRPWKDELLARPYSRPWVVSGLGLSAQVALFWLAGRALSPPSLPADFMGEALRTEYTYIRPVDDFLSVLVAAFGGVLSPSTPDARMQLAYFVPVIMANVLDWTIESYRVGNQGLPTAW